VEDLINYLKTVAAKERAQDDEDFNPYDVSGGNFDDAFYTGCSDGEIDLARELLSKFFN